MHTVLGWCAYVTWPRDITWRMISGDSISSTCNTVCNTAAKQANTRINDIGSYHPSRTG